MTLTTRTVISDALHDAGLVDINRSPDAVEAEWALSVLNRMALAWPAEGVHTGWAEVAIEDEFPLDEQHREGVTAMLVAKVLGHRGAPLTAEQAKSAERGYALLAADYKNIESLRVDDGLLSLPSQRTYW